MWEVFSAIDADGSGDVDIEEMQAVMMRSRVSGTAAVLTRSGVWICRIPPYMRGLPEGAVRGHINPLPTPRVASAPQRCVAYALPMRVARRWRMSGLHMGL